MAIAFDAATFESTVLESTPTSTTHVCTGSNRILFVGFYAGGTVTGVTYGGVAMTLVDVQSQQYLYYLIAPASGSNTVAVSFSSGSIEAVYVASYTGAKQSGQPDASAKGSGSASSMGPAVTTIADNAWTLVAMQSGYDLAAPTAGSGTTARATGNNVAMRQYGLFDSNSAKTPAGSVTLNVNFGGAAGYAYVMATIAPTTSVAYTLTAAQGSFALTGQTVAFTKQLRSTAAQGSFALTGQSVGLMIGKGLQAVTGTFAVSGQTVSLTSQRKMAAAQGAFTLTGQSITFLLGKGLQANTGSFGLTGFPVTIRGTGSWLWTKRTKPVSTWTDRARP